MQDFWQPTHGCIILVTLQRSRVQNTMANPGDTKQSVISCCMTNETESSSFNLVRGCGSIMPYRILLDFDNHLPTLLSSLCPCPHCSFCPECCSLVHFYPSSKQATTHSSVLPTHGSQKSSCLPLTFKTACVIQMPSEYTVVLCTFFVDLSCPRKRVKSCRVAIITLLQLLLHRISSRTLWGFCFPSFTNKKKKIEKFMEIQSAHSDIPLFQLPLWTVRQNQLKYKYPHPLALHVGK